MNNELLAVLSHIEECIFIIYFISIYYREITKNSEGNIR